MGAEPSSRRLIKLAVEGLLGRFDHELTFPQDWRFLILHGPNGVGKTRLLELIHCAFNQRYRDLTRIPFAVGRFEFEDGSWIEVRRGQGKKRRKDSRADKSSREFESTLQWQTCAAGEKPIAHEMDPHGQTFDRRLSARIEAQYPVEQLELDLWLDHPSDEYLSTGEIAQRYGIPIHSESGSENIPDQLRQVLENNKVHLIETQRLLAADRTPPRGRRSRRGHSEQRSTVESYSENLCRELDGALATNSRTSQTRDRSFPSRLFRDVSTEATESQLRDRYAAQQQLRSRLANIAILDSSTELDLPDRTLAEWERRVLQIYLDDADAKLTTFQPLLERLELLKEIVNERFLFKKLDFDRNRGFSFTDEDSGIEVDLRALSSGEQHEVVVMYDLLMNAHKNALVLIDEPEISLHVAWQKAFLNDLDRVASLTEVRFIIATHSPQIIGSWWNRAVELYTTS